MTSPWATDRRRGSPEFRLYGCDAIEPADPQPRLAAFLNRFSPAGCMKLYARLFRVPEAGPAPLAVGTGAMEAGSTEGAEAGLAVSRELLSHLLGGELPKEAPPPETIGDATRLYRWVHGGLFDPNERSSSFLVWRSGSVVASIFVGGGSASSNDRAAVELAHRQQRRIEAPTPYTPAEGAARKPSRLTALRFGSRFRAPQGSCRALRRLRKGPSRHLPQPSAAGLHGSHLPPPPRGRHRSNDANLRNLRRNRTRPLQLFTRHGHHRPRPRTTAEAALPSHFTLKPISVHTRGEFTCVCT